MRILIGLAAAVFGASSAYAGCELTIGPCSSDSRGNTYRHEQNLGDGYTTYRNGEQYSTTRQTMGGGYQEERRNSYDQPEPRRNYDYLD